MLALACFGYTKLINATSFVTNCIAASLKTNNTNSPQRVGSSRLRERPLQKNSFRGCFVKSVTYRNIPSRDIVGGVGPGLCLTTDNFDSLRLLRAGSMIGTTHQRSRDHRRSVCNNARTQNICASRSTSGPNESRLHMAHHVLAARSIVLPVMYVATPTPID